MKIRRRFLLILAVLFLTSISCETLLGDDSPARTTDEARPEGVLFQDDFSDPSSGWDRVSVTEGITDYQDGQYRIYVQETGTDVWANPGLTFQDVRVEVDATKVGGPDDNDFGVICRSQDLNHFYFFLISSDGYYGIGKVSGEEQELIGTDAMMPSETIRQGSETNHIRADCIGDQLTLYVNSEQVGQATDDEYASGDVGLMAGTFSESGVDIFFDNFVVREP